MFRGGLAVLPNVVVQDTTLSMEALIVFLFIRSYESSTFIEKMDLYWLIEMTRLPSQTVIEALEELEAHTYTSQLL